ncbi:MAG: SpoIIE family protein phosphatase [Bacteroidetes bacterium]|nr:SpoIIE family protein phosphatase [Bacteroidota bacterium]
MITEKKPSETREKVDAMNQRAFEIRNSDTQQAIALSQEAQKLSMEINYPEGKATALANEGFCYVQITNYELALEKLFEALPIFEGLKNEKGIANTQYNLTLVYFRLSDFSKGLDNITKAISYYYKVNDKPNVARCLFQHGYLYLYLKDTASGLEYFLQSLNLNRELNNKEGEAAALMGMGQGYTDQHEYEKSKEYLIQSMELREKINDKRGHAAAMNAYMTLCCNTGNYEEAEKISLKGVKLATELGDKMGICRFKKDLGNIYLRKNKIEEAERVLLEVLENAERINFRRAILTVHYALSEVCEKKGDYKSALQHFQLFHKMDQETAGTDAAMKAKSMQLVNKIENAQKEAEINRLKNVELKNAFDIIAEKNKDITDSINYARRIQQALLASDDMLKRNFKEYFVLYKPKDIVSGDFYWAVEKNGCFYLAVCDSTGHGVPGAFMSLLNISFLNEAISEKNISNPNEVFNHARKRLVENISSDGAQDGMDAILLKIDNNKLKHEYSAANNAPIWVKDGKMLELPYDKMPIGLSDKKNSFKLEAINAEPGTILYFYTDGFADQFGGPQGKKFKYKQLQEKLLAISDKPLAEQKNILEETFENWKGNNEQTDDVLIVGIKI